MILFIPVIQFPPRGGNQKQNLMPQMRPPLPRIAFGRISQLSRIEGNKELPGYGCCWAIIGDNRGKGKVFVV